ncbi:MAG: nascent polypeptide-associated complex protein [Nanoarchaeota archaeon]|nr:nascent polypeptide-associated complex protein [Nanoarchaeota archaeon]
MMPFGNVDPKKMHDMLKKMGIKSKDIEADEVIIKQGDKRLIIREPKISEVEFSGQKTFQIHGNISEEKGKDDIELKDKDIKFVSETAKVSKDKARETLEKTKGDIAKAILILRR